MTELQKCMAGNEAFRSDILKSFVVSCKGQLSGADSSGEVGDVVDSFFAPTSSTLAVPPTTTTTSTSSDETDNANANVMIQESRTDNVQQTTETNQNTINANRATTTTSTATTTTTTATSEEPDSNANIQSEVAALLTEMREASTHQALVQQLTEVTADAHQTTCINSHTAVQEARARFMAGKDTGLLPDMSKLSLSAGAMWEKMTAQMMPEMEKTIKFCKLLPGFSDLCLDDQMLLIKKGTFEVMMTRFCMLIDHEKETMLDPSHKMVCPRQVILEMPMGKFLDGFFRVAARFNPLGLTDSEIGLYTAVLAFSPSRRGLKEGKVVSTIQSLYLRALLALMKQNHSDAETKFSQVLGLAPMFRGMSEEHSKALEAVKKQSPDTFDKQFPPLHKELYVQEH